MKIHSYIFLFFLFASCQKNISIPKNVSNYLNETIKLLKEKSIHKNEIDWKKFEKDLFIKAQHAKNLEDVYPTISYAVKKLNDNHSYFKSIIEIKNESENNPLPTFYDEITPDDIGYIRIPYCIGSEKDNENYITSIRTKIDQQAQKKLKGWIIDLRGNFGGNMWPMLLALEPLIGNGTFGYFIDANENSEAWKIIKGKAYIKDQLIMETNINFSNQVQKNPFMAILTDSETASSGEAVTVAFKGQENTKSFGQPTFGVSTGCVSHLLSDGSSINLAESIFLDRHKTKYGNKIVPDFVVEKDKTLQTGIAWIYKMNEIPTPKN
ncbi:MAG: S41 family peptidase [Flavobacterium sp.]|nr:S41 family peptidase [Flavobacterium sp.]